MSISIVLGLLGGLALFLYGMQMMSSGLEAAAGNRMKGILEKLTSNPILGVIVGAGITAVIQSSSATTVMVVGFVNSGMLSLQQAVWIIMGANIGTTITGQLIALDVGAIAPLLAFAGVAVVTFSKKQTVQHYGQIVAGLGILFLGMEMMSSAMSPLRDSETFISLMTQFGNPVIGILVGAVFTAIIQSSSASVGILQTLAIGGLIDLPNAVFVLFGQNIGTCITAVLASIGTSRNAKRTTIIHLTFNIIGTIIFTIVCILTPLTTVVQNFTPDNPAAQIANMHTLFNVVTTLLLLPFGRKLAKLAVRILPEREGEEPDTQGLMYIKPLEAGAEYQMGNAAIAFNGIWNELRRMEKMTRENVEESFTAVMEGSSARFSKVEENEEYIDYLNKEISKYISRILVHETNRKDSSNFSSFFRICSNLERIGDHAMNICEYTQMMDEKKITFSREAKKEIENMRSISLSAIDHLNNLDALSEEALSEISGIEQQIDQMTEEYRQNQMERMRMETCEGEAGILYSEMLTDFERIGDHVLNIGQELATIRA
ncbi:MAG TPA: Na/Pi cotransporter family protein [Candidatus Anaerobutyricum stercoris]|uniref:Na/Pi cotransporter family protein n=1 Tax=Candidatus Anaerobutyricum stercoris TaxID=2838457 RepID=A0A9D2ENU6_9FIRM|nr:Na/Pi cotransporter family protein [Eubacterium sp. An3]OUO29487.1 Na/Pi-cotransporter [Eubacterium sp. An3]CVI69360.1 Na+/Pi-cotransporter [Eubacteriaceae bacterium CHKCI004]HIZ40682.1 Na/Pi cotransporter family protein [Candidatus Anaerobutyricum stercoris]